MTAVHNHIDQNPLGSAAGFGVSLPLDRFFTTKELGFKKTQINSLYCQNSRGKFESIFLEGLVQIMLTLGRLANDMLMFTTKEFDFFEVEESLVTGSSIMPQKKNLDFLEILRGNVSVIMGNQQMIKDICRNLLSGYNRDLQLIKKPLLESVEIVKMSLSVMNLFLQKLKVKKESIVKKISPEIFAADIANDLVKNNKMPFREAYKKAWSEMKDYKVDYEANIKSKISLGGPGNYIYKE